MEHFFTRHEPFIFVIWNFLTSMHPFLIIIFHYVKAEEEIFEGEEELTWEEPRTVAE
jgi:hypothetical protein